MSVLPLSSHHISFLFSNYSSKTKTSSLHFFPRTNCHSLPNLSPFNSRARRRSFSSICFATNFPDDLVDPIYPSKTPKRNTVDNDVSDKAPASSYVDEWGEKAEPETEPSTKFSDPDPPKDEDEWGQGDGVGLNADCGIPGPSKPHKRNTVDDDVSDNAPASSYVDEWGEKAEPETEPSMKFSDPDPPKDEDEWGQGDGVGVNADGGIPGGADVAQSDKRWELKRCLVDTVYGSNFGFRASAELRAEALELVSQLEAANPTPEPTEAMDLLDGNWVLLFTAFSELLPLLAAGTTPLLKVERICQSINTSNLTIENIATLSSPVSTLSFSASATFEIRSPSRIQVEFKEGVFKPPEINSDIELPENVDIFGQKISLLPVQQSLNPLQSVVAGIASAISGQPPLKIPIPGERTKSWLLVTYLDKDLRISRGDGGLFVLAREGSNLLDH